MFPCHAFHTDHEFLPLPGAYHPPPPPPCEAVYLQLIVFRFFVFEDPLFIRSVAADTSETNFQRQL